MWELGLKVLCSRRVISFKSISLSVRMELLGSNWTDFHVDWCFSIFAEPDQKIQLSLKSVENNRKFTSKHMYFYANMSPNSPYNEKCFRQNLWSKFRHTIYVQ
jgi:hypothetical protein